MEPGGNDGRKPTFRESIQKSLYHAETSRGISSHNLPSPGRPCLDTLPAVHARLESRLSMLTEALGDVRREVDTMSQLLGAQQGTRSASGSGAFRRSRSRESNKDGRAVAGFATPQPSEGHSEGADSLSDREGEASCGINSVRAGTADTRRRTTFMVGWPGSVPPRQCFVDLADGSAHGLHGGSGKIMFKVRSLSSQSMMVAQTGMGKAFSYDVLALDPHSRKILLFKALSIVVLVHDLIFVPYMLAWCTPYEGWLYLSMMASAMFWVLDLATNFVTGFVQDCEVHMGLRKIAAHYVRTWFAVDLLLVSSDLVSCSVLRMMGVGGRSKWLFHLLRCLKVGRLWKIRTLLDESSRIITDESYLSGMKFTIILAGSFWFNHVMCCAWHAIGLYGPTDTGGRWIETMDINYMESEELYQYTTSLHWSVGVFLGGEVEMYCLNSLERVFNIFYLVTGLIYGSVFISVLSAALVERNAWKRAQTQKFVTLRRYLHENSVDRRIGIPVQQQIVERIGKKERVRDSEVMEVLALLSSALRTELRLEIFRRHIVTHPLFCLWADIDVTTLHSLCMETLSFQFLRTGDEVFTAKAVGKMAFHLVRGVLKYTKVPRDGSVTKNSSQRVEPRAWMAEVCLWAEWVYVGTAEAITKAQVLSVDGQGVCRAMVKNSHVQEVTLEYFRLFHQRITNARPPQAEYPDELRVENTDFGSLVLSMDKHMQVVVGLHALERMKVSRVGRLLPMSGKVDKLDKLRNEIEGGKCTVMVNEQGEVQRFVSLVAVRLLNEHGQTLVQLGKKDLGDDHFLPSCALPAQKQWLGESVTDSYERLLDDKLLLFTRENKPTLDGGAIQRHEKVEESTIFGINTKYLRYECTANTVTSELPEAECLWNERIATCSSKTSTHTTGPLATPADHFEPHVGLTQRKVFLVNADQKLTCYAWLSQEEFDFLSSSEGKRALQTWLAGVGTGTVSPNNASLSLSPSAYPAPRRFELVSPRLSGSAHVDLPSPHLSV